MSRRSTRTRVPRKRLSPDDEEDEEVVETPTRESSSALSSPPSSAGVRRGAGRPRRAIPAPEVDGTTADDANGQEPSGEHQASEVEVIPAAETSGIIERKTPEPSPEPVGPRYYDLSIVQQPEKAMAAGLELNTLGRLPLIPMPILQLTELTEHGEQLHGPLSPNATRRFLCSCSLIAADDFGEEEVKMEQDVEEEAVDYVDPIRGEGRLQALIGQLVCDLKHTIDLSGRPAAYFIFGDVSVRQSGRYRIRFSAFEAQAGTTRISSVVSDPFDVFERDEYPGHRGSTPLTRHLYNMGVPMRLAPLEDPDLLPV